MMSMSSLIPILPEIVQRKEVGRLAGWLIYPRSWENFDCLGQGPKVRFVVARKVCYPREAFLAWLQARVKFPSQKN